MRAELLLTLGLSLTVTALLVAALWLTGHRYQWWGWAGIGGVIGISSDWLVLRWHRGRDQ